MCAERLTTQIYLYCRCKNFNFAYRQIKELSDATESFSRTHAARSFSNMTVRLGPMRINSTMFILAVCGRRMFPQPKIVGGDESSFGKWPWQVSIKIIIGILFLFTQRCQIIHYVILCKHFV